MEKTKEMKKFSKKTCEELKHYVYKLIDPRNGNVFYIGEGVNNRVFDHVHDKEKYMKEIEKEKQLDEVTEKIKTIQEIHDEGLEVIYVIHRHGLTKDEALLVEAALIDDYAGLSNIQPGHGSNEFGPMNAIQIENHYSLEKIEKFDEEDKVLIIKIRGNDTDYYEQGRKWWVLNLENAKKAKTAVIVRNGEVKCVVNINKESWKKMDVHEKDFKARNRYGFEGEICEDSKYLHKLIPDEYMKKGSSNPIQYAYDK